MANENIVAVDVGSGLTKGTDGKRRELLASVVVRARSDGSYGGERATPISWREAERWLVAEDALAIGEPQAHCNTYTRQWAGSEGWRALLYAMLARLGASGSVRLVTGVPMAWYQELAEPLRKQLNGHHRFWHGTTLFEIDLDVEVVPQAVAALYYHSGQLRELPSKLAVIEAGTYTTGFSVVYLERPVI